MEIALQGEMVKCSERLLGQGPGTSGTRMAIASCKLFTQLCKSFYALAELDLYTLFSHNHHVGIIL